MTKAIVKQYVDMVNNHAQVLHNVTGEEDSTSIVVSFWQYNETTGEVSEPVLNIHPDTYLEQYENDSIERGSVELVIGEEFTYFDGTAETLEIESLTSLRYTNNNEVVRDFFTLTLTINQQENESVSDLLLLGFDLKDFKHHVIGGNAKVVNNKEYYVLTPNNKRVTELLESIEMESVQEILDLEDEDDDEEYEAVLNALKSELENYSIVTDIVFERYFSDVLDTEDVTFLTNYGEEETGLESIEEYMEYEERLDFTINHYLMSIDGEIVLGTNSFGDVSFKNGYLSSDDIYELQSEDEDEDDEDY